jgi:hypothetical protein
MKTTFWMSVAAATILGMGSAYAATFNYSADGGVVDGEIVDHDLSGPVYDPTKLYGQRGTMMYRNDFSYPLAGEMWSFPAPTDNPPENSGLSWGISGETNPGPFTLDTRPVPLVELGDGNGDWNQSGAGFRPAVGTVETNGTMEVFGWLVHFNRDIRARYFDLTHAYEPKGMDMNISWTLRLNDGMGWSTALNSKYVLHFWETVNAASYPEGLAPGDNHTCPHSIQGTHTVHFSDGTTNDFIVDYNVTDVPKPAGAGCDDAWSFAPLSADTPSFMYNGHQYDVHIAGFFKWEYDERAGEYICDGSEIPFDTLWADESNETIGCIKFSITEVPTMDQGCTPGYWKQPQHLDDWVGYAPTDSYNSIFGVDATPYCGNVDERNAMRKLGGGVHLCNANMSLGEALWMRGNADGLGQVIFQSTAALLNAANGDISYPLTEAEIISKVQGAFADPSTANAVSSELDGYNNLHNNDVCGYEEFTGTL